MKHHTLFGDRSDLYAKIRPHYPDELFAFLASQGESKDQVWDVACGSGQAAIGLAKHFDEIHATDVSEQQIAHALPNPRVHYSVQPAEKTNFHNGQFSLVTVAQALHWFDYKKFWPEVKRVLKPKGVFAAWGYSWFDISTEINQILREKFLMPIKPYWAKENKLLWDGYRDIPFPLEKVATPEIKMEMEWDLEALFAYIQTWSAARQCLKYEGKTFLEQTHKYMKSAWGNTEEKKRIVMDFVLLVGKNSLTAHQT